VKIDCSLRLTKKEKGETRGKVLCEALNHPELMRLDSARYYYIAQMRFLRGRIYTGAQG
jgi:hypothetical protein